ncbi:toprim domain-containing protein [Rhizobium sp. BR 317]|uniref:DUF7146 domain-containing protein n=1 Tax=Rhizobium sp. BR 317 TaxID=3040015 RepID=UPI0039BEFA6B
MRVTFNGSSFTVYSQAGDDWKRCKDYVRDRLGSGYVAVTASTPEDDRRKTEFALNIWHSAVSIVGSPAAAYLSSRGVPYQSEALRWHPFCPFGNGVKVGCLVALVRNIITDEPQAIHRTAIDWSGRKLSELDGNGRKALGSVKGGAIKLFSAVDSLGIGEGIETTLSIRQLPGLDTLPVWSVLNAAGVAAFPALPGVRSAFVAIDNDRSGTGEKAASALLQTLTASGTKLQSIRTQKVGTDLNDLIMEMAGRNV